jgi:hypothetical protein
MIHVVLLAILVVLYTHAAPAEELLDVPTFID